MSTLEAAQVVNASSQRVSSRIGGLEIEGTVEGVRGRSRPVDGRPRGRRLTAIDDRHLRVRDATVPSPSILRPAGRLGIIRTFRTRGSAEQYHGVEAAGCLLLTGE